MLALILVSTFLILKKLLRYKKKQQKKHVEWLDGYNTVKKLKALGPTGFDPDEQNSHIEESRVNACERIS